MQNLEIVFESESDNLETFNYNDADILNMGKVTIFKIIKNEQFSTRHIAAFDSGCAR